MQKTITPQPSAKRQQEFVILPGKADATAERIVLHNPLCPGDNLVSTVAVAMLHLQHPGKYLTDIDTPCPDIWKYNPDITPLGGQGRKLKLEYPMVNRSNQTAHHFIYAYIDHLSVELGIPLKLTTNAPYLYFSSDEKKLRPPKAPPYPYLVICSGVKNDYTVKGWGQHNWQQVVNSLMKFGVRCVQVGEAHHMHKPLSGVHNLIGRTTLRELLWLCLHSVGGLGHVSLLHHVYGALRKPFVTVASGMEARHWEQYSTGVYISRQGQMTCCRDGGCWKARVVPLMDGDAKDKSLCSQPCVTTPEPIARCLAAVDPSEVSAAILDYVQGGIIKLEQQ